MVLDPSLIHYACIAKGTTVLAEFNSNGAELSVIAAKCLEKTPPFHATFTHTIRSKTYTFLIVEPFVYFAIFDEKLENPEGLAFLKSVKDAFCKVFKGEEKLTSHCFQGEFYPVFRELLDPSLYHADGIGSPAGQRVDQSGILQCGREGPAQWRGEKGLSRVNNRLLGQFNIGRRNGEKENDNNVGNWIGLSREFSHHENGGQKAKKAWMKQVWFVLSLDLVICSILFAVWLWFVAGLNASRAE